MNPTISDPVIDEIREIRHRISASCDHDPAKLVAYLMQYQEQFRDRLITTQPNNPPPNKRFNPTRTKRRVHGPPRLS